MDVDPPQLSIRIYPDPVLRKRAQTIEEVDASVEAVALRMIELMRQAEGIGLAGPQVGLSWRIFVAEVPPHPDEPPVDGVMTSTNGPWVYINPVLSLPQGTPEPFEEGCLSLPAINGRVLRPPLITIEATDLSGNRFTQHTGGLLSRCCQHEFDHLEGTLIIDKMDQMSRLKTRSAIRSLEKDAGVRSGRR